MDGSVNNLILKNPSLVFYFKRYAVLTPMGRELQSSV